MNKGAITNILAIQRPLSLYGLTANLAEYKVPEVKALQKYPGEPVGEIEVIMRSNPAQPKEVWTNEASLWIEAAQGCNLSSVVTGKGDTKKTTGEIDELREENKRLKRTLVERFSMKFE